jgi:hypothetical protein
LGGKMSDKEKVKEEFREACIEYYEKHKKIESIKIVKGLDGHDSAKSKQITLDFLAKVEEIIQKYQIDETSFLKEEMIKIGKKYL